MTEAFVAIAINWKALSASFSICLLVILFEAFMTGDGIESWYPTLKKPKWHLSFRAFIVVGVIVYMIDGFVAYRALTAVESLKGKVIILTTLIIVMILNALWNALMEYRSTFLSFIGIILFLAPLTVLQTALFVYDSTSAWTHMLYTLWVVFYDLPLFFAVWRLNRNDH